MLAQLVPSSYIQMEYCKQLEALSGGLETPGIMELAKIHGIHVSCTLAKLITSVEPL